MPADLPLRDLLERLTLLLRADDRRSAGLRPTHRALLRYLARANRYSNTPGAAARYLAQTKGTVSQSLGLLERRGYVKKEADPADRRVVRLRLTAKGQRVVTRDPDGAEVALAGLPEGVVETATRSLERVLAGLRRATGGRTFGTCPDCRWLRRERDGMRCGLTREALEPEETTRLCVEHEQATD